MVTTLMVVPLGTALLLSLLLRKVLICWIQTLRNSFNGLFPAILCQYWFTNVCTLWALIIAQDGSVWWTLWLMTTFCYVQHVWESWKVNWNGKCNWNNGIKAWKKLWPKLDWTFNLNMVRTKWSICWLILFVQKINIVKKIKKNFLQVWLKSVFRYLKTFNDHYFINIFLYFFIKYEKNKR